MSSSWNNSFSLYLHREQQTNEPTLSSNHFLISHPWCPSMVVVLGLVAVLPRQPEPHENGHAVAASMSLIQQLLLLPDTCVCLLGYRSVSKKPQGNLGYSLEGSTFEKIQRRRRRSKHHFVMYLAGSHSNKFQNFVSWCGHETHKKREPTIIKSNRILLQHYI